MLLHNGAWANCLKCNTDNYISMVVWWKPLCHPQSNQGAWCWFWYFEENDEKRGEAWLKSRFIFSSLHVVVELMEIIRHANCDIPCFKANVWVGERAHCRGWYMQRLKSSLVSNFTQTHTQTRFLPQPAAPVTDCWPMAVKGGCVHMDLHRFCMSVCVLLMHPLCVWVSDVCSFVSCHQSRKHWVAPHLLCAHFTSKKNPGPIIHYSTYHHQPLFSQ